MADVPYRQSDALDRIDRAITRIEAATAARDRSNASLAHRHNVLRTRMAEAIASLDSILAHGGDDA